MMSAQLSTVTSESISLRDSAIDTYMLQRTAFYRHGTEFDALNEEQRHDVTNEVRKQALIQRASLLRRWLLSVW